MKCHRCGSEHITVINQPIQLNKKTKSFTIGFLSTIASIVFIVGIVLYFEITRQYPKNADLSDVVLYVAATKMISESAKALILIGIINAVRPNQMTNKIVFVCLDCGHVEELREQPFNH